MKYLDVLLFLTIYAVVMVGIGVSYSTEPTLKRINNKLVECKK